MEFNQENVVDEMLERFGLAESAPVRVPIGGEDEDEGGALLPFDGRLAEQTNCANFSVVFRQSVMDNSMHTTRLSICGAPSDPSFARVE